MKFKKGDMVQHVPSGSVGKVLHYNGNGQVWVDFGKGSYCFDEDSLTPYRDPSSVIEAARVVAVSSHVIGSDPVGSKDLMSLAEAIDAYDGKQPEDEEEEDMDDYKWLAMDIEDEHLAYKFEHKPTLNDHGVFMPESKFTGLRVNTTPSWLKPGQLWVRGERDFGQYYDDHQVKWDGYVWELVEDHRDPITKVFDDPVEDEAWKHLSSEPVEPLNKDAFVCGEELLSEELLGIISDCRNSVPLEFRTIESWAPAMGEPSCVPGFIKEAFSVVRETHNESAWITDRRPTEEDADDDGLVVAWEESDWGCLSWGYVEEEKVPWQPVPQCLRTPPEPMKSCETCKHYKNELCYEPADYAWKNPTYGMDGCNYGPKYK